MWRDPLHWSALIMNWPARTVQICSHSHYPELNKYHPFLFLWKKSLLFLCPTVPHFPVLQDSFSYSDDSQGCVTRRFFCIANELFQNIPHDFLFARTLSILTLAHTVLDFSHSGFKYWHRRLTASWICKRHLQKLDSVWFITTLPILISLNTEKGWSDCYRHLS